MSEGTASNYNTAQYGSNHRIFYEGIGSILSALILEVAELSDDRSFTNIRSEFIGRKVLDFIYTDENIPNVEGDEALKLLAQNTLTALLAGSTESSISGLISALNIGAEVFFSQPLEHIVNLTVQSFGFTGVSEGHRHLVLDSRVNGLSSTTGPIGWSWGDDLHQHDIIDGVVQEANGHTHTLEYNLPVDVLTLQQNILKLLRTTKPAHIKIGDVSSLISETITSPQDTSVTYIRDDKEQYTESESDGVSLVYTMGASFQENLRKPRLGTYERVVLGYASGRKIRVRTALISVRDSVKTNVSRKVTAFTDLTPSDGTYDFLFPRLDLTETYEVSGGLFSVVAEEAKVFGDGEIVVLSQAGVNKGAYFVEILSRTYCRVRALEITLDAVSVESGLVECEFLDYPWRTRPLKYRDIVSVVVSTDGVTATFKLNAPLQKVYQGLPITKDYIYSDDGLEIVSFDSISNLVVVNSAVLSVGDTSVFRAPFGEGDLFNFTELNNSSFVLNNHRNYAHHSTLSGRGADTPPSLRSLALGDKPAVGLFPVTPIRPYTTEEAVLTTPIGNTSSLNNEGFTLGGGKLKLNQLPPLSPSSSQNIKSYATGTAIVRGGKVPYPALGFIPSEIISIIEMTSGDELEFTTAENIIYLPSVVEGTQVSVTAISRQPLGKITEWAKSESVLSEHQVPFINTASSSILPSPEQVMSNPQGLKILDSNSDEPRNNSVRRNTYAQGVRGEEVFYEDDFLNLTISSSPFISELEVFARTRTPYLPSLVLNSSSSHLGSSTALVFSLAVLEETVSFFAIGEPISNLTDTIPSIDDEVLTSLGIGTLDAIPSISDEVETALTLVSISLTDSLSVSDAVLTSLYLYPSAIVESIPSISDEMSISLSLESLSTESIPSISDEVVASFAFSPVTLVDTLSSVTDQIQTFYTLDSVNLSDEINLSDHVLLGQRTALVDSLSISDDVVITTALSFSTSDSTSLISDDVSTAVSGLMKGDSISSISDDVSIFISLSTSLSDNLASISDDVSISRQIESVNTDTLSSVTDDVVVALNMAGLSLSDTLTLISDDLSVSLALSAQVLSDTLSSITDVTEVFLSQGLFYSDTLTPISDEVSVELSLLGANLSDNLASISDDVSISQHLSVSLADNSPLVSDEVITATHKATSIGDILPSISDQALADLFLYPSGVSDTLGGITDTSSVQLNTYKNLSDNIGLISDDVGVVLSYTAVSVSDSLSISDDSWQTQGLVLGDSTSVTDDISYLLNQVVSLSDSVTLGDSTSVLLMETLSLSDSLSSMTDDVSYLRHDIVNLSETLGGVTDALSYFSEVSLDLGDSLPVTTDEATGDYNPPANFTVYAALTGNSKVLTDAERFIVYTADDYFARRGSLDQTLFSSIPTAVVYQDSASTTFLTTSDTRRGFIKPLIQSPAYANTTPPSANISWALQEGSVTDGEFMPNIDYSIITRTLVDDPASDISMALQSGADGADTHTVMGASPTYNQLYPSTTSGSVYYKHTFRVDSDGVVTFTQDTTPKSFVFPSTSRIYFYVQNDDGGLGAGAAVASSIRVLNGAGTSYITPTIHVSSEVSNVSGTATFIKSTITNPNNISQVSWTFTPMTNYRIVLNRDDAVNMKLFMRVRSGTGSSEYNTLYSSSDILPYKGFDDSRRSVMFYLQIMEDGTILITN